MKVKTSSENIFVSGNSVYYKCACNRRWKGPAVVLIKEGKQALVAYDDIYVHLNPCRIALDRDFE